MASELAQVRFIIKYQNIYICGTLFSFHIIALTRPSAKLFTPITLIIFLHQQMTTLGVGRTFSVLCVLRLYFSRYTL